MDSEQRAFSFTQKRLGDILPPARGRVRYRDTKVPGLSLRVTANGAKSYEWYRKVRGRQEQVRLGGFPELSVADARDAADRLNALVAQGMSPQEAHRARREEATFGDLWSHWLEHARQHKRESSRKEDGRYHKGHLKSWDSRRLSTISKVDVQRLHSKVGENNGRYTANRLLSLIRAMFNKAPDLGFRGDNPAIGVQSFREESRDRFLSEAELKRFHESLGKEEELISDFFMILLLTGARRSNVQALRWEALDLSQGFWKVPAEQAKAGEPMLIPLSPPALEILQRRRLTGKSPWVFPSYGKTGHLVEPKSAWKRICTRAGLSDLRPHDLRRTLGSWMAIGGASLPIIGRQLGHRSTAATQVYARLSADPVRAAVEQATAAMMATKAVADEKEGQSNEKPAAIGPGTDGSAEVKAIPEVEAPIEVKAETDDSAKPPGAPESWASGKIEDVRPEEVA